MSTPEDPYSTPPSGDQPQQPAAPGYGQPPVAPGYGQSVYGQPTPVAPGYGQPPAAPGYGQPAPTAGTNGLAIASLVCAFVGIITCGVASLIGVVLGLVALSQIKKSGQQGRGLALAGVIVGGIIAAIVAVIIIAAISIGSSVDDTCSIADYNTSQEYADCIDRNL